MLGRGGLYLVRYRPGILLWFGSGLLCPPGFFLVRSAARMYLVWHGLQRNTHRMLHRVHQRHLQVGKRMLLDVRDRDMLRYETALLQPHRQHDMFRRRRVPLVSGRG